MSDTDPVTRAVILARGLGTRMRAASGSARLSEAQARAAATGVKALVAVGQDAGARPFLDHQLSELADAGLTRVCLVIGPEHEAVREHLATLPLERLSIDVAVQEQPLGTADAVRAARAVVGGERFVVVNSDNFYPATGLRRLVSLPGCGLLGYDAAALVAHSNIPAARVAAFALLSTNAAGDLVEIVEKPTPEQRARIGERAPVSMNCWLMGPEVFAAIDTIAPSPRGELELPDAVRAAVAAGTPFRVVPVCDPDAAGVLDLSGRDDIAQVADRLAGHEVRL